MDLLKTVGIPEDGEQTDFYISKEDDRFADEYIAGTGAGGKIIGVNPMGSWITKRWQPEKFAGLIDALIRNNRKNRFIVLWGPGERSLAENIAGLITEDKKNVFIAPETSIKQMGALISRRRPMWR